jgi:O-Antigen ligase
MPEHLRAFVVVIALGYVSLRLLSGVLAPQVGQLLVSRWQGTWLMVTAAAFLSNNFWIYSVLLLGILAWLRPQPHDAAPLFLATAFAVPASGIEVPGFGVVNYLFELNHTRLLALALLLPAALKLSARVSPSGQRPGRLPTDRWVYAFLLMACLLQFRQSTFTDSLRACFLIGLDAFLPYYVISRSIRDAEDIRRLMGAFVVAAGVMGVLGLFEMVRVWNLYAGLVMALDTSWGFGGYLLRDGMQRASVSTGQAIVFGYVMALAFAFWLFLKARAPKDWRQHAVMGMLLLGLVASLSRGPWLGAGIAYVVSMLLVPGGLRTVGSRVMLVLAVLPVVALTPWGDKVMGLLPFVGNVDTENIDYRSRLIDNALLVIERHLFFGSASYFSEPEMLAMVQGQGIIDVVNTYLATALSYGVVGLFLFVMAFLSAIFPAYATLKRWPSGSSASEARSLGQCLVSSLVAVMFMIFTVSSISVIPLVYWGLIGMCGAYAVTCLPGRSDGKKFPDHLLGLP